MKTTIINGKEVPVVEPTQIITTISNSKTGEVYVTEEEWKAKGIAEADIKRDVKVMMPALDLFAKTK
jgi:membrane-bound ClpP family serine protease|tara:strand:+ start:302 stop:502 length:201 start_codon:yes stop_codon:yes gene_type:complete